jgi:two-component system sensor kinase FixL
MLSFTGNTQSLPQDDDPFRNTLELLPFAILVTNRHGEIVLANAALEKLFGYSRDELIGASADALVPGLRDGAHIGLRIDTASGHALRAASSSHDVFGRRKEGTEFPAEITTNPLTSHKEALMLTVVIDRTERYELQRNRQDLAHLTRVSTLGELAGSLAHELNQPLTAMLSNAQAAQRFMAMDPIDLDEVREILHDLVADNRRASEVIRRIRALLKKGELEAAPLSLADVIGDVVLLLHSDAIVRGVRVFMSIDPELPPVHGDRVQLQQVVLNLLLNAFDAMESHGVPNREVVIEASVDDAGSVRVAVRDLGPGLADDIVEKLFTPFFTSKRDGLGLGLSISRSIVDMHGGRIWAENNAGEGATFYFTLPTGPALGAA